ncbi:MAG: hypothetical protein KJ971_04220 [Firmicutes bacterium]|nr:hypothetical protein [Bacillota bacterium]
MTELICIDKEKVKEELIKKNLFDLQKNLLRQRRVRMFVMSILLAALLLTIVYGTIENPITYTLSNIGNFFEHRVFFIVWAMVTGVAIQSSILALFRLEEYLQKTKYWFVILSVIFLVFTALIPALKDDFPFWHLVHTLFAGLHALFLLLSFVPFVNVVGKENPRLKTTIKIWLVIIWGGGILTLLLLGHSAIFELWFFMSLLIFLLYLSLVLFEEKIVKMSVAFLKDETNLNLMIEKIFVDLEKKDRLSIKKGYQ